MRVSSILCKHDMEKTYDNVNWDFLFTYLRDVDLEEMVYMD